MVKRGRPSLNLTPEERIQRRRLQLVASQRKRRAHKRLALELSKSSPGSEPNAQPVALPPRPDKAELCQFYDALFLGQDGAVTLSSGGDAVTGKTKATTGTATRTTTGTTAKTSTRTVTNATRRMPSPNPQAPLAVCHECGSAPLDANSDTGMANAPLAAAVGPHSRASLLQTSKLRTDAYAPLSRLEDPNESLSWVDYTSAQSGKSSTSQVLSALEHVAYSNMPLLDSGLDSLGPHGFDLDSSHLLGQPATGSNRKLVVKESDNVFLPGRFSRTASEWMPTNSNETPYSHRHIKPYHRRPPSPSWQDSGPAMLSVEAADLSAPWAGTKQAIPMGF
ncbi:hypothetical protein J3F83DRAFT_142148 [Trichoderma novae-zelandiae]